MGKQLWPWPPVLVTPAEPASKEPLVFISRCWKLGSCCYAHLISILDLIRFTWALGQDHFGTRCIRRHCQQQLQQLRSQFYLSDVVFVFPHIISMAFQNVSPENATAYKLDETKMLSTHFFFKINPLPSLWSSYFIYCVSACLHKMFVSQQLSLVRFTFLGDNWNLSSIFSLNVQNYFPCHWVGVTWYS